MKKIKIASILLTLILSFTSCSDEVLMSDSDIILQTKAGNDNPNTDAALANFFDANGNLCVSNYGYQTSGTALELWMGVGNQNAGTKVGEVTFNGDCVRIDMTKGSGVYDLTAIHMDFVNDYDDFETTRSGNPKVGKFSYNYDSSSALNTIRVAPSVYEICGTNLSGYTLGAIHVDAIPGSGGSGIFSLEDFENALPDGLVTMSVSNYVNEEQLSYFRMNIGADGGIIAGECEAFCVDPDNGISRNFEYSANVYSTYETLPAEIVGPDKIDFPENLDIVNYLLNKYAIGDAIVPLNDDCSVNAANGTLTAGDIQAAIWDIMGDKIINTPLLGPWDQKRVNAILCDVLVNGDGFVPDCGDNIYFLVVPIGPYGEFVQPVICKVPIVCEPGIPGIGSGTAWADGKYGIGFPGNSWATYFGVGCN